MIAVGASTLQSPIVIDDLVFEPVVGASLCYAFASVAGPRMGVVSVKGWRAYVTLVLEQVDGRAIGVAFSIPFPASEGLLDAVARAISAAPGPGSRFWV